MSVGAPVAADVPDLFDVIINGKGYIFLRAIDTSLPFRTQRALYSRTPTFVERSNTSGSYGDNQQDFFLTESQDNWILGEQQRFFRPADAESTSRYWDGQNVNVSVPGQVSLTQGLRTVAKNPALIETGFVDARIYAIALVTSTNLWTLDGNGTLVDKGAHGLGATPLRPHAIASDDNSTYLSYFDGAAGPVGVRRYSAGAFSTFSATPATSLAFNNNTLYWLRCATTGAAVSSFGFYSTAGVTTTVFTWQGAEGTAHQLRRGGRLYPFGGQVLILMEGGPRGISELWIYDGNGVKLLAEFPESFSAGDLVVSNGVIFISGQFMRSTGTNYIGRSAVLYIANGNPGLLWQAPDYDAQWSSNSTYVLDYPGIIPWGNGIAIIDNTNQKVLQYDLATGGVSTIVGGFTRLAATQNPGVVTGGLPGFMAFSHGIDTNANTYLFPSGTYATSGFVSTSLFDFDNSLTKQMRGIKVDWIPGTDGNGGSVDISYQVDSLDGAYTSLQVSAVSGQEYIISGVSGRAISVKVTINKGTSTKGPILKRIYVRAAPVLQSFRQCEYILDTSGVDGLTPVILNDNNTPHPLDGFQQASNLQTAIAATTPFSITDRFGTYTGIIEPDKTEIIEVSPEEYIARIYTREV